MSARASLADEVRRRLETGVRPHAAARKERDVRRIDVPADRLRGVPRVLVLREQDQTSGRPRVSKSVARTSGSAGSETRALAGKRVDERAKPLARGELDDEWAERRRVHTGGGTSSREAIVTSTERLTGAGLGPRERRGGTDGGRRAARPHHGAPHATPQPQAPPGVLPYPYEKP